LVLLALCYLGVLLVPELSLHAASDVSEQQLAGDWRGTFGHKNLAAPIMAMLVFVGLYLASRKAIISGIVITALSVIFLINSRGKGSIGLCVFTLLLSGPVCAIRNPLLRASFCFLPLVALNLLTVGSVFNATLAGIVQILPFDATFTGRTDVWEFAVTSLGLRPVLGHGFAAFWKSGSIENLIQDDQIAWVAGASHSHNGYLDTALTLGLPGLALVMIIFVLAPLKNFSAAMEGGNDGPLARLFLRVWLFGIYLSSIESFLLDRADPIWFTFLIAVFGLHYISRYRLMSEPTD